MTVSDAIYSVLQDWGGHPCFLEVGPEKQGIRTSAEECRSRIFDTALQLKSCGIRSRYLVPIFLDNSTDFIYAFLALIQLGAVPVLVKMDYRRLELDEVFQNAQPQAVIAEQHHLQILKPYLRGRTVVVRATDRLSLDQSADDLPARDDIPDDIASINYTYRGYGYPLGAMVSHAQYLHGASVLQDGLQGLKGEKMLVILPMAHIFTLVGCILVPLLYRMTSVITRTMHPRLLFQFIRDLQIDHISSVPEIYELLCRLRDPSIDLSSLKVFVSGGSLLTPDSFSKITRAFSIDLLHGYGLTEFTPVSRNIRGQARAGTIGPMCSEVQCRIGSPDKSGVGEILIKTAHLSRAYYRRPRESSEALFDGWFRTGDLGHLSGGHLVFSKEKKNTRKINGNIVDLEELTRAIRMDPDVADVALSCEKNQLCARLGIASRFDFKEKALRLKAFLKGIIAEYKVPKQIEKME